MLELELPVGERPSSPVLLTAVLRTTTHKPLERLYFCTLDMENLCLQLIINICQLKMQIYLSHNMPK